jgi:ribose 5-phosphate isomerase A
MTNESRDAEKADAAEQAMAHVRAGMLIGLGTGTTAAFVVAALARLSLDVRTVATSERTAKLAREHGLEVLDFSEVSAVDLAIDGADEIDAQRRAIKGGGGALFREKVVAASAKKMIAVVDSSKPVVGQVGKFPLPIEVVPFAAAFVEAEVRKLFPNITPRWREGFATDQGNRILDLPFGSISDPERVADLLSRIPGVLEHGLFLTEIDDVIIGRKSGAIPVT